MEMVCPGHAASQSHRFVLNYLPARFTSRSPPQKWYFVNVFDAPRKNIKLWEGKHGVEVWYSVMHGMTAKESWYFWILVCVLVADIGSAKCIITSQISNIANGILYRAWGGCCRVYEYALLYSFFLLFGVWCLAVYCENISNSGRMVMGLWHIKPSTVWQSGAKYLVPKNGFNRMNLLFGCREIRMKLWPH